MDLKQAGLGVVLFIIFWAFQAGYLNGLGTTSWVIGVILFGLVLWLIGKGAMPRQPESMKELWMFTYVFAVVLTAIFAWGGAYMGQTMSASMVLSAWLMLFGGAMLLTGMFAKMQVTFLVGIIWLFSAIMLSAALDFLSFGLLAGLPFIIYGIMSKK
jgi:hypothetical protein